MSTAGTVDNPLEVFSGLVTEISPSDLPAGASPNCQDVQFPLGSWRTRPGLGAGVFGALPGNPTINYQKTFIDQSLNQRFLFLDSNGSLNQEFPQGTLTTGINSPMSMFGSSRAKSATAYGKEFIAFSDGQFGLGDPFQWDGTHYERVSQVGPGAPPTAFDENATINISSISQPAASTINTILSNGPTSTNIFLTPYPTDRNVFGVGATVLVAGTAHAAYDGSYSVLFQGANFFNPDLTTYDGTFSSAGGTAASSYSTFTTATPHGLSVGQSVTVASAAVAGYDGTWVVVAVLSPTQFTAYVGTGGLGAAGAAGTIVTVGHVPAGLHQVSVFFVTRAGYFTKPAPPFSWTAAGNKRVTVTGIPTGPANVVQRIIIFTTAAGATFFFTTGTSIYPTGNMVINDNTTTTATFDFDDTELAAGNSAQYLFNLLELEESAGVVSYATRLFWWGGRNRVPNFINMTFDGGWALGQGLGGGDVPLGWASDPTNGAGGSRGTGSLAWADCYSILGNGSSAIRGMITQSAYQDYLGNPILLTNTPYSVRIKSWIPIHPGSYQITIDLFSASLGTLGSAVFSFSNAPLNAPRESIGAITAGLATIPSDLQLRLYASNTLGNLIHIALDDLEIFPTNQPYLNTTMRASYAGQPESYDELTGVLQPFFQDGGTIRKSFVMREKLYIQKDNAWYVTQDDGSNEPSAWTITVVSLAVGCCGIDAGDLGEDWGIFANRAGPYLFWGSEPVKIGQEIETDSSNQGKPTWDSINWEFGYTIWVVLDRVRKRALIGAPIDGATTPNIIFYFDFVGMDTAQEVADHWSVKYSAYTGKILAIGNAPKWAPWNISSNSCALIERNDGTAHTFIGNGAAAPFSGPGPSETGKIYDLLDANKNDDGAGIPWSYTTYLTPSHQEEQALQIRSHRKLYSYLTGFVKGAGAMAITLQPMGNITPASYSPLQLVDPTISNAITGITRQNGVTTVTCSGGHGLTSGVDVQALIQNAGDPSFNGTMPIAQILNSQQFTISQFLLPDLIVGAGGTVNRLSREFEIMTNVLGERVSYTFSNFGNAAGCWGEMEKLIFSIVPDPWSPVRGSVY